MTNVQAIKTVIKALVTMHNSSMNTGSVSHPELTRCYEKLNNIGVSVMVRDTNYEIVRDDKLIMKIPRCWSNRKVNLTYRELMPKFPDMGFLNFLNCY